MFWGLIVFSLGWWLTLLISLNVLGVIYLDFIFKILHHSDLLEGYCFISRDYRVITVCQQWFITCKTKEYIPDYPNNEQNRIKFLILLFKH